MSLSFTVRLVMFVLLFVALIAAIFTQQFGLALPYLCLAPWVGLWFGRATVGVFSGFHWTRLSRQEQEALSRFRRSQS